jgi:hypothetical protein
MKNLTLECLKLLKKNQRQVVERLWGKVENQSLSYYHTAMQVVCGGAIHRKKHHFLA